MYLILDICCDTEAMVHFVVTIKSALWTANPDVMAKRCFVKPLFYCVSFQLGSHYSVFIERKSHIIARANCSAAFSRNKSNHTHKHMHTRYALQDT